MQRFASARNEMALYGRWRNKDADSQATLRFSLHHVVLGWKAINVGKLMGGGNSGLGSKGA